MFGTGGKLSISQGMKIYILVVIAIALIAVLLLVIRYPGKGENKGDYTSSVNDVTDDFPYHLIRIPRDKLQLFSNEPLTIRNQRRKWSQDEIEPYWIPVEPIVIDILNSENERAIEDIFKNVP